MQLATYLYTFGTSRGLGVGERRSGMRGSVGGWVEGFVEGHIFVLVARYGSR